MIVCLGGWPPRAPYSGLSVARNITVSAMADDLATDLQRTHDLGLKPNHVAEILSLLVTDRRQRESEPLGIVDLVWSGPEMNGVTNRDTPVVVHELFSAARTSPTG